MSIAKFPDIKDYYNKLLYRLHDHKCSVRPQMIVVNYDSPIQKFNVLVQYEYAKL